MKAPRNDPLQGRRSGVFLRGDLVAVQMRRRTVNKGLWLRWAAASLLLHATLATPQSDASLDRQYQSAVAEYDAGHFSDASAQLEKLLPYAPSSFEIHELLGLAYASQSQDDKAMAHLKSAVRLKPDSGAARINLATC